MYYGSILKEKIAGGFSHMDTSHECLIPGVTC